MIKLLIINYFNIVFSIVNYVVLHAVRTQLMYVHRVYKVASVYILTINI